MERNNHLNSLLQYVIGFDSVDDESKPENAMFDIDVAVKQQDKPQIIDLLDQNPADP